ncbi:MAG TPA: class I SAM-dependent methyltransferase [Candidatus Methylacidiphilales bacterium]|jgi:23S rRNA (cytosine1962-C5)-methyltransferase|nr:class I SAM-dependent methyltransferase [Candidatus Methylacidiphilales bacterium]
MKHRPKTPPVAMPFRRGRKPPRREPAAPPALEWISPATFAAITAQGTDAHRLASGAEAWLERFGPDVLLSYQTEPARDAALGEIDARCAAFGYSPRRIFGKYIPTQAPERMEPALLRGAAGGPMETEVTEAGVRYGLDFAGGYSAGLFIDQRDNRARLRAWKPQRLLNTFAYTCSFSVVAALAGAETLSVDLSRRSLTRGEGNFTRNGLDPKAGHRFIADDVLAVLPRLARRGEKFDAIVLDPPTFSRNQAGAAFQVQRDFEKLVALALEAAAPGAKILLSVNHSGMRVADLEWAGRHALKLAGRVGDFLASAPLPDFPAGHGAKTVWLELR